MTLPRAMSDLLMCRASNNRSPDDSDFFSLSEPARSTRCSLPVVGLSPACDGMTTSIVKTVCDRDDVSFILVASVARRRRPRSIMSKTSAHVVTRSLARPLTKTLPSASSRISSFNSYHSDAASLSLADRSALWSSSPPLESASLSARRPCAGGGAAAMGPALFVRRRPPAGASARPNVSALRLRASSKMSAVRCSGPDLSAAPLPRSRSVSQYTSKKDTCSSAWAPESPSLWKR
mmetsp:Transcript_26357/g.90632  ORF Transcript_26357/g.90632 Transcript_26357/m.90632 type:complete len:235 (+) Transcript_26357:999-1703(+)